MRKILPTNIIDKKGHELQKELTNVHFDLCFILSITDQYLISNLIKKTKTTIISIKLTRKHKLCNLTQNILLSFLSTDTALNLFSGEPTDQEKNIVRSGLKHFIEH